MAIDCLDAAYIAIGAKHALDRSVRGYSDMPFEGECSYVRACIDQAPLLARAWEGCNGAFPGVWCYEVAEPFGRAFGKHLLAGGAVDRAGSILEGIVASALKESPA
ncbi:hypothetical protein [Luteimonas changyuni]|uniref:hypothetical protein n=1 Tax=Luteimonas sp. MJ145 TaxID=3129234 RepID=UPI0031BB6A74